MDELRLISICLLCIIHRSWILLFIFSEADTEDSQRSTDANIDLGHMKMIFFGNRKIWHISIYRTFTKVIHLLSHCIIKIYIFYLYVYLYVGHKKQSLVITSGIEEEKEKDPIVNEVTKQQVLVQYLKVATLLNLSDL